VAEKEVGARMSRGLIALLLAAAILVGMAGAANYSLEPNI